MKASAPSDDELAEIACPVRCAAAITRWGRLRGTLPRRLARLRRRYLVTARLGGYSVAYLARETGLTHGRVSQLTRDAMGGSAA